MKPPSKAAKGSTTGRVCGSNTTGMAVAPESKPEPGQNEAAVEAVGQTAHWNLKRQSAEHCDHHEERDRRLGDVFALHPRGDQSLKRAGNETAQAQPATATGGARGSWP
jgi:hypothetical protein